MHNSNTKDVGFGSLEGETLGDFYTGDEFSSIDSIPDIDTSELEISDDVLDFPDRKPPTPAELEQKRIAERADKKPSEKKASINLKLKFMKPPQSDGEEDNTNGSESSGNTSGVGKTAKPPKEPNTAIQEPKVKPLRIVPSRTRIESYGDSQGSINKIKLPKIKEEDSYTPAKVEDKDEELASLAKELTLFSIEEISDYQIVSPTPAEFIAQYYRVLGIMITKISLNELVPEERELDSMWVAGKFIKTLGMSQNFVFVFDQIYGYCTQDNVLKSLRSLYAEKRVYFAEMTTHQIMGAGHGISSAKQATFYLEKMVAVSISSTISMLSYKRYMIKMRTWFEDTVPRFPTYLVHQQKAPSKSEMLAIIQSAVSKSSKEQAMQFADNDSVYVKAEHHCLLFAKKYLNTHMNVQIPNTQLQLSALIFLMSGTSFEKPKLATIAYDLISNNLKDSEVLSKALVDHSYRSHRHCYPINELSKF